ncbi:MAG: hypothetical protein WC627_05820 [Legionella sp.]|jgi:hypothetical protein
MSEEKRETALALLKREIQAIKPELKLDNDEAQIDINLANKFFVNKDLINNDKLSNKKITIASFVTTGLDEITEKSEINKEQYGNQVLLAIWRIANIADKGYKNAYSNREQLQNLFSSIDEDNIPKIINETTYKAGEALQKFLKFALTNNFLEQIPNVPGLRFRDNARSNLTKMSELLKLRMDIYKLHTPEKIITIKDAVTAKNKILDECKRTKDSLDNTQLQILSLLNIVKPLTTDSTSTTDITNDILEAITAKTKACEDTIRTSKQTYEVLQSSKKSVPNTITSSLYIDSLINPRTKDQQLVKNWVYLYNQDQNSYRPRELDINNEVTKALAGVKQEIDSLETMLEQIKTGQQQLLNRLADAKGLEDYESKLQKALEKTTDEAALPEVTNIEEKNIDYFVSLIEQYETYQKQITDQTQVLMNRKNKLSTDYPIPEVTISSNRTAFETAQKAVETQLDQNIASCQKKITEVELLIYKAQDELKNARENEAQKSQEGRERFLVTIQESIQRMKDEHKSEDKTSQALNEIVEKLTGLINGVDKQLESNKPDELESLLSLKLSYQQQKANFAERIKYLNQKHQATYSATLALTNLSLYRYQLKYKAIDIAESYKKLEENISAIKFENLDDDIASLEKLKNLQYAQQMKKEQNGTSGNKMLSMLFLQQTHCDALLDKLNKIEPSPALSAQYGDLIKDIQATKSSLLELEETDKHLMDIINRKLQTLKNLQHIRATNEHIADNYPDLIKPLPWQKPEMNRNQLIDQMAQDIKASSAVLNKYRHIKPNAEHIKLQQKHDQLSLAYETMRLTRIKENADSLIRPARSRNEKTALQYYIRELHRSEGTYLRSIAKVPKLNNALYQSVTQSLEKLDQFSKELNLKSDYNLIENEFEDRYSAIEQNFYQIPNGIFPKYLKERATKYALSDLFESWAAWGLSFFSYKTRSQERKEFITIELKEALDKYKTEPQHRAENFELLSQLIETGLEKFAPRAKKGDNYQNSLHNKLTLLQLQLNEVNQLNAPPSMNITYP